VSQQTQACFLFPVAAAGVLLKSSLLKYTKGVEVFQIVVLRGMDRFASLGMSESVLHSKNGDEMITISSFV
jgi:hypothetical protein